MEKTICGACQMGKQTKASHHKVNVIARPVHGLGRIGFVLNLHPA